MVQLGLFGKRESKVFFWNFLLLFVGSNREKGKEKSEF